MTAASDAQRTLAETWGTPRGIVSWISQVNHKAVGLRFIITAFIFFVIAGLDSLVMRSQLARPEQNLVSPETYNQLFTMHGTTMMFLFAVPMMEGLGIYFVPLMIGARDMAFPRLNTFGYWVFLLAGATLYFGFAIGSAPDGGWFAYVPLTGEEFSPTLGMDFWTAAITFLEISALVAAVELIVTILKMRAPGMSLSRMPVFVWAILVMSFMIIFAMPPLILASLMLAVDRTVGGHFFNVAAGGEPLLWQHLFWFFGHPEVYIILLPALGMVSMIVPTFARRPLVGHTLVVLSTIAIGIFSFGLWVHHMFAVGLPQLSLGFFSAASMMIAIPSGIQIFALIATIWRGRVVINTSILFIMGFIFIFVLGGITGVMVAAVPYDLQVHDTYFVVAHFHYVLIGGAVFPLVAAIYYWFPKLTGRVLSERIGKWNFALMFTGLNVTFFPMHITGLIGMPRRVYTYPAEVGWGGLNLLSTVGAFITAAGILLLVINMLRATSLGPESNENPWNAPSLEWATASPPDVYNFRYVPQVSSRYPLWDEDEDERWLHAEVEGERRPVMLAPNHRENLGTTILDAQPDHVIVLAGSSIWPLMLAIASGIIFLGILIHVLFVPLGIILVYVAIIGWAWPYREEERVEHTYASHHR
ncbi:cytochrome c oxidase subunit I [soil metagenome]